MIEPNIDADCDECGEWTDGDAVEFTEARVVLCRACIDVARLHDDRGARVLDHDEVSDTTE